MEKKKSNITKNTDDINNKSHNNPTPNSEQNFEEINKEEQKKFRIRKNIINTICIVVSILMLCVMGFILYFFINTLIH